MAKLFLLFIIFSGTVFVASAQTTRYTVYLKDKQGTSFHLSQPSSFLSAKSIQRRAKQNIAIDSTDLPVSQSYRDSLAAVPGVSIQHTSKWLNNILVELSDPAALNKINSFPFVVYTDAVAVKKPAAPAIQKNNSEEKVLDNAPANAASLYLETPVQDSLSYGQSFSQIHLHEGEFLHKMGFRGQGMDIAIIDAGFFAYQTNPALDSVRMNNQVRMEYDFVNKETSVNEDNAHGANCFTILAANTPGMIVGSAPKANYYLFKTEETASEKPIEEEFWIFAAERADSAGADMISSSLGYSDFDDATQNITYTQRDGNTAPITIAADLAAKKGMIVMNSAGNSGQLTTDLKYMMCPADGDSVVAVGSVNRNGIISAFSSWGPNGKGKMKPNIVSMGEGTVLANRFGNPVKGNGTSYSNPNIAGLIACLWQAFPDLSNMDIINAVQKSADKYNSPDNRYGFGIPNMRIAFNFLELKRQEKLSLFLKDSWIRAYPVPFLQSFNVFVKAPNTGTASLRILDLSGKIVQTKTMSVQKDSYYNIMMSPPVSVSGIYFLQYKDEKNRTTLKLMKL